MFPNRSCARAGLAVLLAVPLVAAACQARGGGDENKQRQEQIEKLNSQSTFNAAQQSSRRALLAVEVLVRADGVEAVGAKVIRAPAPTNSAEADLQVTAQAGGRTVADYVIPDPRLAEVDRREGEGGLRVLPEARTIVFAPLAEDLTDIRIAPVRGREERASKGGTLDVRALAQRACEGQTALEECQRILRSKPGTTGSPPPAQPTPTPTGTPTQQPRT